MFEASKQNLQRGNEEISSSYLNIQDERQDQITLSSDIQNTLRPLVKHYTPT